jgi:hypothetical protein
VLLRTLGVDPLVFGLILVFLPDVVLFLPRLTGYIG